MELWRVQIVQVQYYIFCFPKDPKTTKPFKKEVPPKQATRMP